MRAGEEPPTGRLLFDFCGALSIVPLLSGSGMPLPALH